MSEYIINGTLLTNIADAVRSVDGSTSTLTPQQMTTRLNAVKSSIDSALSALTAKEVEVPSGSTIHGLAELIASIQAGGRGVEVETGSFTLSSDIKIYNTDGYSIVHGLSNYPDIFILLKDDEKSNADTLACYIYYKNRTSGKALYGGTGGDGRFYIRYINPTITTETVTIISDEANINKLINKIRYIWIAIGGVI